MLPESMFYLFKGNSCLFWWSKLIIHAYDLLILFPEMSNFCPQMNNLIEQNCWFRDFKILTIGTNNKMFICATCQALCALAWRTVKPQPSIHSVVQSWEHTALTQCSNLPLTSICTIKAKQKATPPAGQKGLCVCACKCTLVCVLVDVFVCSGVGIYAKVMLPSPFVSVM